MDFARKMGFGEACIDQASDWMIRLYELFIEKDATMIEINPMSEDLLGRGKWNNFYLKYMFAVFFSH